MNTVSSPGVRLLLLTNLASPHSIKWVRGLAGRGYQVTVFSLSPYRTEDYADLPYFTGYTLGLSDGLVKTKSGRLGKLVYLKAVGQIKDIIRRHRPDIVHAHRATSYGLLGALTGFHPFVVSVWGDDVYVFPERNAVFRQLVKFVLRRADQVLSTSHVMAMQTAKYTDKEITVTPFGIDMNVFSPAGNKVGEAAGAVVVGTIKTLEAKYGIDYLLRAFAEVSGRPGRPEVKLLIIGDGSQRTAYQSLAEELGITRLVEFTGRVPFDKVPDYHRGIDVFAALSTIDAESFGVAIIEASASGKPVVVSDAGGPAEVVVNGQTGFIVPKRDASAAATALATLVDDAALRQRMGTAGRDHAKQHYDWEDNLTLMESVYASITQVTGRNLK